MFIFHSMKQLPSFKYIKHEIQRILSFVGFVQLNQIIMLQSSHYLYFIFKTLLPFKLICHKLLIKGLYCVLGIVGFFRCEVNFSKRSLSYHFLNIEILMKGSLQYFCWENVLHFVEIITQYVYVLSVLADS